jgi:hypothetical protein
MSARAGFLQPQLGRSRPARYRPQATGFFLDESLRFHTGARLRMSLKKVPESHEQLLRVFDTSGTKCLLNIVNDHCPDRFTAARLLEEIVSQRTSGNLWDVLVLSDGGDLALR